MDVGTLDHPSEEFNRWQNYDQDTDLPQHHISFNGVVDLPFGKGKPLLRNSRGILDALFGGYQVAFIGNMLSQSFTINAGYWGPSSNIKIYKDKVPVTDCTSGVCRKGYMWFNGYIAPNLVNTANGIMGVPADYVPYATPINNTPGTKDFGNNNVNVTLKDGTTVPVGYSPGPDALNPFSHTVLPGPFNFEADISLYKTFSITEGIKLRFNIDAFNAFNIQGLNTPNGTNGILEFQTSHFTPRQVQFSLRLTF
ncbi:MAG: hypothetical protein J2P31_06995, partial [Blastocatellia bacterium]|nr:hypothetical protein [Blastocatellia bacterium]